MGERENERVIAAEVVVNAWRDDAYRGKLIGDPAGTLRAAGLDLPAGCRVTVLEDGPDVWHVAVPRAEGMVAGEKERFMAELAGMVPLPGGRELRLHQNTDDELFLVLPRQPQGAEELSDEDLKAVLGSGSGGNGGVGGLLGGNGGDAGLLGGNGGQAGLVGGNGGTGGDGGLL